MVKTIALLNMNKVVCEQEVDGEFCHCQNRSKAGMFLILFTVKNV